MLFFGMGSERPKASLLGRSHICCACGHPRYGGSVRPNAPLLLSLVC